MPCKLGEVPAFPTLPDGLSVTPSFPSPGGAVDLELCCKIPGLDFRSPITALPTEVLRPPILLAARAAIASVREYLNKIPITCPRE